MAINKIKSTSIEDDAITSAKVADGVISAADVADGTITSAKLSYPLTTFSSTGIDDNATSTAVTIDSSENFMVGTTTAQGSSGTTISQTGDIYASKYASTILTLNRTTTDGNIAEFEKDGTTRGIIATESDGLIFSNDTRGIKVRDDACLPRNVNLTTADNIIDLGTSGSRFKDLYLGGGLYVGGTAAANKLDDYEEGTWTPTMVASGSGTITLTSTAGIYTKIGNLVYLWGIIDADLSSESGTYTFGGVPFSSEDVGEHNHRYSGVTSFQRGTGISIPLLIQFSTPTSISIYKDTNSGAFTSTDSTNSNFSVRFALAYRTTS